MFASADDERSKDGLQMGKSEISDAKKSLQKTAGLGHKPNVVPDGPASINSDPRRVEIGWHPVAGSAGKWFADSIIGAQIQQRTKNYPGMVSYSLCILSNAHMEEQIQASIGQCWWEITYINFGE